jgi:hypothetical protein
MASFYTGILTWRDKRPLQREPAFYRGGVSRSAATPVAPAELDVPS